MEIFFKKINSCFHCFLRPFPWFGYHNICLLNQGVISSNLSFVNTRSMQFSLVSFSLMGKFKRVHKYLVRKDFSLFYRVNPSFVRKVVAMCIIDFICAFLVCADYF